MKKKILSLVLCISLLLSMFSGITYADETVNYTYGGYAPAKFDGYYVFNKKTDVPEVTKVYMGGSYYSMFSVNSLIKKVKWNVSADASSPLSTYIGRADRSRGFAICYGGDVLPEVLCPSARKGDLKIAVVMQGYADKHSSAKYHWDKKTTNVDFKLKEDYSKVITEYYSEGQRPAYMGWMSESQRTPNWYNMKPDCYFPYFDFTTMGCGCGGVHFNNISVMLKDTRGPVVTDIYPSSDQWGGNRRTNYKAGETVYFNVRFNENVKFSDDAPGVNKILKVKKKHIATNIEQTDTINATYYNLMGNTMIFKYVVPSGGEDFEFYSDSIADWSQQNYLLSDEETFTYTDPVLSPVNQASIESKKLNKVNSCIVDISGNPMERNGSTTSMSTRAYMDNVKPVVQRVEVEAVKGNDNQAGSKTYLKAGDKIVATAVFSEEIGIKISKVYGQVFRQTGIVEPLAPYELEATLNINGKSVNVQSSSASSGPDGVRSGTIVTKVSFPYTIKATDVLDDDRINITDIHFRNIDGSEMTHSATELEITDARGNTFATTANNQVSSQQYELDNDAPTVEIEKESSPTYYQNENPCEFYYKVNVSDTKSGILGKLGLFSIKTSYNWDSVYQDIQYSVTDNPDKPLAYKLGKTEEQYNFPELPGGAYIHIKLPGQKATNELRLTIRGFDRNDNFADKTVYGNKINGVKLIDTAAPDINAACSVDDSKNYVVAITANDESTVSKISYQWVASGSAISIDGWTDVPNTTTSSSLSVNLNKATEDKYMNEYTLYIKAVDEFGNETATPASYDFQLDRLAPGAEIIVSNFDPNVIKQEHDIKAKILDPNTVVYVEWKKINEDGTEGIKKAELKMIAADSIIKTGLPSNIPIISYPARLNTGVDTFDIAKYDVNDLSKFSDTTSGFYRLYGEDLDSFYGTYRVYITAARIIKDKDGDDTIASSSVSSYTMKFVGKNTVPNFNVKLSPILPDGAPKNASLIYDDGYVYHGTGKDEDIITNLKSTEGVRIKIDIKNDSTEQIGLDYIDFDKSRYEIYRISRDMYWNVVTTPIYEKKLEATQTQYMTIPDEVLKNEVSQNGTSQYRAMVTLIEKNGKTMVQEQLNNVNYNNILNDITVDRRKVDACGPSKVRAGDVEIGTTLAKYSIETGRVADTIYIGNGKTNVEFTCATLDNNIYGKTFFKLWQAGSKAEDTTWGEISGSSSDSIDQDIYSTYSVIYEFPNDEYTLAEGENHLNLKYQFMFGNGEQSEIRDLIIFVDPDGPTLKLGCDNASSDGTYFRTNQPVVPHIETLFDSLTPQENMIVKIHAEMENEDGELELLLPQTTGGGFKLKEEEPSRSSYANKYVESSSYAEGYVEPSSAAKVYIESSGAANGDLESSSAMNRNIEPRSIAYGEYGDYELVSGAAIVVDEKGYPVYQFTRNGTYEVSVMDQSGNAASDTMTIDWIDKEKPTLSVNSVANAPILADFNLELKVSDGSNDTAAATIKSKVTVLMQYDYAYSELPMINAITENREVKWFDVTDTLKANFPGKLAINSSVNTDNTVTYNLSGELAYDPNVAEGTNLDRTIRCKVVDAAGNESEVKEVTISKANTKPAITSHGAEQGIYGISFNTTVQLDSLCKNPTLLARKHSNISIYENGTHKVAFRDLFGNKYEETLVADIFEKAFEHSIAVSETLSTNKDVDVELDTAINDGLYFLENDITIKDISGAAISDATVVKTTSNVNGAGVACTALKISLKSNAIISYTLKSTQTNAAQTFTIPVLNIDKTAPSAHIVYDYEAPIENDKTAGYVTAYLVSDDEEIHVTNGTGQSHLFTVGNGESYTFEFQDLAGNTKSIVAKVDATINKTYFANDTTPPDYSIALSSMNNNGTNKFAEFTKIEHEKNIADPTFKLPYISGRLLVEFDIIDINKVTLSLKAPNANVSIVGDKVIVSGNAQFTVLLRDANNNCTEVAFNISTIDNQAPTGTVKYEVLPDKSVRAYLTMADDISQINKLRVLNTSGVEFDDEKGYYISFIDNGSNSFIISDEAGNVSFIPAAVAFIDKTPPNFKTLEWVPFKYTLDNKPLKDQLSDKKFNGNVTAFLVFSEPIKEAKLLTISEQDKVELTIATMSLLVTIKENTAATIQIEVNDYSDNTKTVELPPVSIIDKEGPVVESVTSNPSDFSAQYREVEYTFNLNENAYFTSETFVPTTPGEKPQAKKVHIKKIIQNGEYNLSFTDEAGNISYHTLVVKDRIDTIPPSIMLSDVPATKKMIDEYNKTATTPASHMTTNQSVTFEISMSKKGTLSVNSTKYKVAANEKIQVVAPYNGIYSIMAEDEVGYNTNSIVEIDCIDKVKPVITVPSIQTIEIKKDTALAAFTAKALSGVTAKDNCDGSLTGEVTLIDVTQNDLNTAGIFYCNYSATDKAGNTTLIARRVKVYAEVGFNVFANGKLAENGNLIMVTPEATNTEDRVNITTTLNSLLPVKMYFKKGIQTEGTMKTGATAFTGGFNVTRGSYYTIYLQTQDRVVYLTYVYVTE